MLNLNVHLVTLKLLRANAQFDIDYLKTHVQDTNAWQAYFELSSLSNYDLFQETFPLLPQPLVVDISIRFAESVLPIFESKYLNDNRPRKAIEAARAWLANPCQETVDAAYAAANAARAAVWATSSTANAAAVAACYATDAAANAAYYAAKAAYYAADANGANKKDFEKQQLKIVLDVIRNSQFYPKQKGN